MVTTTSTNPNDLVSTIVGQLKVVIEGILDEQRVVTKPVSTFTTTTVNKESESALVSRIISQLRPTIISTVQREVSSRRPVQQVVTQEKVVTTTTTKDEFSVDLITDLVGQLQNAIQTTVNEVIVGAGVVDNVDILVDEIIVRLQPEVRAVITSTVNRRGLNYSTQKINRLHTRVVQGIRPIIRQTIQ